MKKLIGILIPLLGCGMGLSAQTFVNFTINQPPQLTADAGNGISICPGAAAQLNVQATGGENGYNYGWIPSDSVSDPTVANPVTSPATSQTYVVTVSDGNNCTASDSVTVTLINCLDLEEMNSSTAVFPNPSQGQFQVSVQSAAGMKNVLIRVTSATGAVVYEKNWGEISGSFGQLVNLENLARGNYVLTLFSNGQWVHQQKITVQ